MAVTFNAGQPAQGSNIVADATLENYVFGSGVHKPEFSSYLTYCYPQYTMTSLLDRINRYEPTGQDEFKWFEMERTREVGTIASAAAAGTGFDVDTTETKLYFVPKDVVKLANDKLGLVTASILSGGVQVVSIESLDTGDALVLGDFVGGELFSHLYNLHEEKSDAPDPRTWLPEERSNCLNIHRRSDCISTTEFTNMTWVNINGKPYWYYEQEAIFMNEFAYDREICTLRGKKPVGTTVAVRGGNGILDFIEAGGVVGTFPAVVTELDLQDFIAELCVYSTADEFLVPCGITFLKDITAALRDYSIGGGVDYGVFAKAKMAGISFQSYKFMGKTLNFVHYNLFDDQKVFPSGGAIDYSNFAIFLNMGNDENGQPLIRGRHKRDAQGVDYKFLKKFTPGISSPQGGGLDGMAANGVDGFETHLYSYIGVELRCANQFGILRKA